MKRMTISTVLACTFILSSFGYGVNTHIDKHMSNNTQGIKQVYAGSEKEYERYMLEYISLPIDEFVVPIDYGNNMLLCLAFSDHYHTQGDVLFALSDSSLNSNENPTVKWQYKFDEDNDNFFRIKADFNTNKLYICQYDKLKCLDMENGKELWETVTKYPIAYSNIEIIEDRIIIPSKNNIVCYHTENGQPLWNHTNTSFSSNEDLQIFLLINNNSLYIRKHNSIYKLNPLTGGLIWSYHYKYNLLLPGAFVAYNDYIFFSIPIIASVFLDKEKGNVVKIDEIPHSHEALNVYRDPIVIGDYMYIMENDNYSINYIRKMNKNLDTVWKTKLTYRNNEKSRYILSDENNIIVSGYTRIYTVNPDTSYIKQKLEIECCFSAVYAKETQSIFFGSSEGFYYLSPAADSLTFQINSNTYNPDNDDSTEMDTEPVVKDGRTLLPARYVTEPLGGQVFWDGEERKVTCKLVAPDNAETEDYKENIVELWIGNSTAKVNGVEVQIDSNNSDVVPVIIDGRTMVPMRFLAESLGCEVEWIPDTKEIILTYIK